jgi:hypothetical protein
MNILTKFGTLALTAAVFTACIAPAEAGRGVVRNGKGSVAAGGSANGNTWARGRAVTANEAGGKTVTSGGGFKGRNGSQGARAGQTTVNPDGSATRMSGGSVSGPRGSASSQGSATRNADGTYNGSRSSTATNAATGNTYDGSTTYDSTNGVSRTATCSNPAGESIPCPR